jgi:succinoglycan biosynthesis protein ExoA
MARQVDVSVLVPVLNEASIIEESAKAMLAQSFDGEIEYLFLDGGSADQTRQILERLAETEPRIKVSDNPARLQSPGLNLGLAISQGEFVARMDAHSYYPPDYIARGVDRLRAGDVAWVGGPQLPLGVGRWSRRIALAMQSRLGIGGAVFMRPLTEEIETDTAFTGIWRRETLEDLGGWDEEAITNEDGELAARIRAQGGRIVCIPEMAAECVTRDSLRALAQQYYRYGQGRVRTLRLHPETMRLSHVLPPALVLVAGGAVAGPRWTARPARLGLAIYLGALAIEAKRISHSGGEEARFAPLVLATMHGSWGAGFMAGCAAHGLPAAALSALARRMASRSKPAGG